MSLSGSGSFLRPLLARVGQPSHAEILTHKAPGKLTPSSPKSERAALSQGTLPCRLKLSYAVSRWEETYVVESGTPLAKGPASSEGAFAPLSPPGAGAQGSDPPQHLPWP